MKFGHKLHTVSTRSVTTCVQRAKGFFNCFDCSAPPPKGGEDSFSTGRWRAASLVPSGPRGVALLRAARRFPWYRPELPVAASRDLLCVVLCLASLCARHTFHLYRYSHVSVQRCVKVGEMGTKRCSNQIILHLTHRCTVHWTRLGIWKHSVSDAQDQTQVNGHNATNLARRLQRNLLLLQDWRNRK